MRCSKKNCSKKGFTEIKVATLDKDDKVVSTSKKNFCGKHASRCIRLLTKDLKKLREE